MSPQSPFFIVGCGRSGTTLLRVMLNRHSQIAVPQEGLFVVDYLKAGPAISVDLMRELIVGEYELEEWGLHVTETDLVDCRDAVCLVSRLHELYANRQGKTYWGHKTPRFVLDWRLLKESFPSARFIHIVRDPRAVANSLVKSDVHRSTFYHGALRWVRDVSAGLEMEQELGGDALRVSYEELVADPDPVVLQMLEFLGAEPEVLSDPTGGSKQGGYGRYYDNIHSLVTKPPSADRVSAWRSEMPTRQIRVVEALTKSLMKEVGYSAIDPSADLRVTDILLANAEKAWRVPGRTKHFATLRRGYLTALFKRKRALGLLTASEIAKLFI